MATLTDTQLTAIADNIFVMRDARYNQADGAHRDRLDRLQDAFDSIGLHHDFRNAGIAVIDFTDHVLGPRRHYWLHNQSKTYRIGSASKIAMMLAAVQLRLDVRRILRCAQDISTPPSSTSFP